METKNTEQFKGVEASQEELQPQTSESGEVLVSREGLTQDVGLTSEKEPAEIPDPAEVLSGGSTPEVNQEVQNQISHGPDGKVLEEGLINELDVDSSEDSSRLVNALMGNKETPE